MQPRMTASAPPLLNSRALDQEGAGLCAVDFEGELLLDDVVDAGQRGRRGRDDDLKTVKLLTLDTYGGFKNTILTTSFEVISTLP